MPKLLYKNITETRNTQLVANNDQQNTDLQSETHKTSHLF